MKKLRAADLFCGAGGTTEGAMLSGAVDVVFALNHWQTAIDTHYANFPAARHVNSRLDQTSPSECGKIDLLFASPECTHHSRARGGRPTSDQQRSGAWNVLPWVEHHRPAWIVIENVVEFRDWGPVANDGKPLQSKKGAFFQSWFKAIESAGYRGEYHELNAADFNAATSRNRLFVIFRKGNRRPVFPQPNRAKRNGNALPGMQLEPWRSAAEIIDWTIPCPSIFSRSKPLADKTLMRIKSGLVRFVEPFVVKFRGHQTGESLGKPISTITAGGAHHGLAVPSYATMTTKANIRIRPWLCHYYGTDCPSSVEDPLDTITTHDRHAISVARLQTDHQWSEPTSQAMRDLQTTMRRLEIADIGFRMLSNPELAAAQGFRPEYIFTGTKAEITKQIGNSVSPPVAKEICISIAG